MIKKIKNMNNIMGINGNSTFLDLFLWLDKRISL